MRNMLLRLTMVCALLGGALSAQDKTGKAAPKMERYDFHPLMQQIWDAWGTLNPDNTARFYSKDPERTFFDLAPLKYTGWNEYSAGVKRAFIDYASAKFTLTGNSHVTQRPNMAWATATGHGVMTKKSGAKDQLDFRWTVIWDKEGTDWLIIHEHVSVPMGAPAAAPAAKPATPPAIKPATAPKK
jgi:ketosteroid isomerase-like protein